MQKVRKAHRQQDDRLLTQLTRAERKQQERIRKRMLAENEFAMGRDIRAILLA